MIADLSWSEALTRVLHLRSGAVEAVVKVGGEVTGHHIAREIAAGQELGGAGLPELIAGSAEHRIVILRFQPGVLVQDTPAEGDPAVFAQAGRLLARVHRSAPAADDLHYPTDRAARLNRLLPRASSLLDPELHAETAAAVAAVSPVPEPIVRTHGDMQPRNWLMDHGTVRLIDFGRYAPRPAYTDLVRVVHRYPPGDPRTTALLAEVGTAVDSPGWHAENLYQALATVVWATEQGFDDFADEGRGMLRRTLDGTMVG